METPLAEIKDAAAQLGFFASGNNDRTQVYENGILVVAGSYQNVAIFLMGITNERIRTKGELPYPMILD